ncbi:hypothetical protein [Methylocystis parvus]|uniref:hypothetical protein n=1 Tax=Methylocystis parvus TaxID=134 RepID=UPI003C72DD49
MSREAIDKLLGARRPDYSGTIAKAAYLAAARAAALYDRAAKVEKTDPAATRLLDPHAVLKADATVGMIADHGALTQAAVGAYVASLAPISAGARLIEAGQRVNLKPFSTISYPRLADTPTAVAWVGEGAPIPVGSLDLDGDALGPMRKAGVSLVTSRELLKASNGASVLDLVLRERAAATIDAAIFSDAEGDDIIHPGLLFGAASVSSCGDPVTDVEALIAGLADAGGTGGAMIACNPREAATLRVRLPQLSYPVLETKALAAGTVVAIDPASFASSFGEIDIQASESATLHMADDPAEIVSGTGPATADPVRSAWQTACVSLRLLIDMSFISRGNRVAKMEGVSWL